MKRKMHPPVTKSEQTARLKDFVHEIRQILDGVEITLSDLARLEELVVDWQQFLFDWEESLLEIRQKILDGSVLDSDYDQLEMNLEGAQYLQEQALLPSLLRFIARAQLGVPEKTHVDEEQRRETLIRLQKYRQLLQ